MTHKTYWRYGFWTGFFFNLFITTFHQDWIGYDEYLIFVNEHWTNIHWFVWVPFLMLGCYLYIDPVALLKVVYDWLHGK